MKTKEGEKFTNILIKVNLYRFSTLYKALYKYIIQTCPKGFGLKLAKLGLKTPLKNKVKQK